MRRRTSRVFLWSLAVGAFCGAAFAAAPAGRPWMNPVLPPDARADLVQSQMTREEELTLVAGYFGVYDRRVPAKYKADMPNSAGYVPGIPRLGIPALKETDASLGVANGGRMRRDDTAVALPATILTAASWDTSIAYAGGAMMAEEARRKGFNLILAGGVNLMREPRGGRSFEYAGEDPLLAGAIVGASIRGIQSRHILSTVKHFALNDQETGRMAMSANIGEAAMRESDLLAFELAIERGRPGAVMCAYNRVNGVYACENDFLLNHVLKGDWGYPGFVMGDWGAVHSTVDAANHGLDQQSSQFSDPVPYFAAPLKAAVAAGTVPEARLRDMVHRILRSMFARGLFDHPPVRRRLDLDADLMVTQRTAEAGIVLLKNQMKSGKPLLPLDPQRPLSRRILVVDGFADIGVLSGGGSSQVYPIGYKRLDDIKAGLVKEVVPGEVPRLPKGSIVFHPPAPLDAIRDLAAKRMPLARVSYYEGHDPAKAAALARSHDIVIVFAQQWMQEAFDNASMALAGRQDALIAAVAEANPRTVVVLETGGPVFMPWIRKVGAVLEAWYAGNRGAQAIANILFGKVNPSGRLPVSFPADVRQLPRPHIPGFGRPIPKRVANGVRTPYDVSYDEGADIGYKWYARMGRTPLFPFGYGLSYTRFAYGGLSVSAGRFRADGPFGAGVPALTVRFTMQNLGVREGKAVGQIYVVPPGGGIRLAGWSKRSLQPRESRRATVTIDPRLLASFDADAQCWRIAAGTYRVMLARSATDIVASQTVRLGAATLPP